MQSWEESRDQKIRWKGYECEVINVWEGESAIAAYLYKGHARLSDQVCLYPTTVQDADQKELELSQPLPMVELLRTWPVDQSRGKNERTRRTLT